HTGCYTRLDALVGLRFLELNERLDITEAAVAAPGAPNPPIFFSNAILTDSFATSNQFYGGQVGLTGEVRWRRFSVSATTKLAVGSMHEETDINGGIVFVPAGAPPGTAPLAAPGGLLAQATNIGHHERDIIALVPEVGINVGLHVTERLRV